MTYLHSERIPPLDPLVTGSKLAVSCHKPQDFLIRAWTPFAYGRNGAGLVEWILHYVGLINQAGLEWWGASYIGQPPYMGSGNNLESGLTIQRYVEPTDEWTRRSVESGTVGPAYGTVCDLKIPQRGVVQVFHDEKGRRIPR